MPSPIRPLRPVSVKLPQVQHDTRGAYNVSQVNHGITNPSELPRFEEATPFSATTMGSAGFLSWKKAHVASSGHMLGISRQFSGTTVNF